ncbi:MAG: hypothetical protein ABS56_08170 [Lautropia sp. SCN 69-89]|nr:MAG: hypothetical protein ABS56_08170 [Lautropia sp. SCN 69-89]
MDAYRLSAAGGALALHALVLAGVLALAIAPAVKQSVEPVQVVLLSAPEPLPLARSPARPAPEPPPRAEPPDPVAAPAPRAPRPAPARARSAPAAAPVPERPATAPLPEPPPAPAPAPEPAPTPVQPATSSNAITPAATSGASTPPATAAVAATAAAAVATREAARGSARSGPHVDATWSGNVPPPYPTMARRMGDQGEVRLDVHVGADGRVTEVRLRQSSGSTLLDRTAIDTVRKWRFRPATVDGQPVAEWYHDWRWVFRLEG